jgi:hypothetical protein
MNTNSNQNKRTHRDARIIYEPTGPATFIRVVNTGVGTVLGRGVFLRIKNRIMTQNPILKNSFLRNCDTKQQR